MERKRIFIVIGLVSIMFWQCSKEIVKDPTLANQGVSTNTGTASQSLKESINLSVARINYAFTKISETQGFKVLNSQNGNQAMAATAFNDSINLSLIAGIYEFQTDSLLPRHPNSVARLFKKTGTSNEMIVKLPKKFIFFPGYLRNVVKKDSTLANNFTITASDYHYYYTNYEKYDYKLVASFVLDSSNIGGLNIISAANASTGSNYNVKYSFNNGYYLNVSGSSGDTSQSAISLTSDTGTLLNESVKYANSKYGWPQEYQYTLTIGNIEIKRTVGIDSIQVYLNGTLQKKAGVKVTDSSTSGSSRSISHSRDIQITFDDGTITKLSTLLNPSLTVFSSLVNSLQNMYFASDIIDYIAFSIYTNSH